MRTMKGLDGIRAIAVAAVLLYSADVAVVPGGFLGIDVFFVLSGYLVTSLLLEEHARTGQLDLVRFYALRARRLLPGLFLVLGSCLTVTALFFRDELAVLRADALASLLHVQNWWSVWADRSSSGRPPVLEHLWPLAVGVQLFLVWPAVVLVVLRRYGRPSLLAVAIGAAVVSSVLMGVLAARYDVPVPADPTRLLVGTDTHATAALLGAAAALVWSPRRLASMRLPGQARLLDALGFLGLTVLGWSFLRVDELSASLYRGGFLLVAAAAVLVVVAAAHPATLLRTVLSAPLLRWIGKRSYAIFLWSWPVVVFTRPDLDVPLRGLPLLALRVALTLGLAALTYRYVEEPLRRGRVAPGRGRTAVAGPPQEWRRAVTAVSSALLLTAVVGLTTGSASAGAASQTGVPTPGSVEAADSSTAPPVETAAPPAETTTPPPADTTPAPTETTPTLTETNPSATATPTDPPAPAPAAPPPAAQPAAPAPAPVPGTDCSVVKCVALTYDDGPGPLTDELVEVLQDRDAVATFFALGAQVREYPKVAAAVVAAGFEMGSHTTNHVRLTGASAGRVTEEMSSATDTIERVTGQRPTMFRPPYGATDATVASVAASLGQAQILWDVDTKDWADRDSALVAQRAVSGATAGSIVLLHDIHPTTIAATPTIIDGLRAAGFTLVSVRELLGAQLAAGQTYTRRG